MCCKEEPSDWESAEQKVNNNKIFSALLSNTFSSSPGNEFRVLTQVKGATPVDRRISLVLGGNDIRFCRTSVTVLAKDLTRLTLSRLFLEFSAGASMMNYHIYHLPFCMYGHLPISNLRYWPSEVLEFTIFWPTDGLTQPGRSLKVHPFDPASPPSTRSWTLLLNRISGESGQTSIKAIDLLKAEKGSFALDLGI
jgi:hypothetical protein